MVYLRSLQFYWHKKTLCICCKKKKKVTLMRLAQISEFFSWSYILSVHYFSFYHLLVLAIADATDKLYEMLTTEKNPLTVSEN